MEVSRHSAASIRTITPPSSPSHQQSPKPPSSWRRLSMSSLHKLTATNANYAASSTTSNHSRDSQQPLTVFAKLLIQPGYERDFEQWFHDMAQCQRDYWPGYLSSELVKPMSSADSNEYISIFRYDNYDHLEAWMTSAQRHEMITRAKAFSQAPPILSFHSLEYWFVPAQQQPQQQQGGGGDEEEVTVDGQASTASQPPPPSSSSSPPPSQLFLPPPKYKMVIVTFLVIWSMLQWTGTLIQLVFGQDTLSKLWFQALTTFLTVLVTAYVAMPLYTAVLGFWLFPHQTYATSLYNGVMSLPWPIPKLTTTMIQYIKKYSNDTTTTKETLDSSHHPQEQHQPSDIVDDETQTKDHQGSEDWNHDTTRAKIQTRSVTTLTARASQTATEVATADDNEPAYWRASS